MWINIFDTDWLVLFLVVLGLLVQVLSDDAQ